MVGWVERSDTHHLASLPVGIASLNPPYACCQMVRDVNLALFGPDPEYEAMLMEDIYLRAEEGWFIGFRGKVREAVGLLRGMGNDAQADDLERRLAAEAKGLADYAAYDAATGYARPAA